MLGNDKRYPLAILGLVHRVFCQTSSRDDRSGWGKSILAIAPQLDFLGDDQVLERDLALQDFGPLVNAVPLDLGKVSPAEQQSGRTENRVSSTILDSRRNS